MRDVLGIILSFLCILHCAGLPFLLPLMTQGHFGLEGEQAHLVLLGIVFMYTVLFLWPYANKLCIGISIVGLLTLYAATCFDSHMWEHVLTIAGSFSLMTAHMLSFRNNRHCNVQ